MSGRGKGGKGLGKGGAKRHRTRTGGLFGGKGSEMDIKQLQILEELPNEQGSPPNFSMNVPLDPTLQIGMIEAVEEPEAVVSVHIA